MIHLTLIIISAAPRPGRPSDLTPQLKGRDAMTAIDPALVCCRISISGTA